MSTEIRAYRKTHRADLEQETRRRITESTVELHGTVGPAATTISAVAEHAGVRRSTVYRHFPNEASLFTACTASWNAANPLPDMSRWESITDPRNRLNTALRDLYAFYRRSEPMLSNLTRDEPVMPIVQTSLRPFHEYLDSASKLLRSGWPARRRVRAAIGHALAFTTWRSLTLDQELNDAQAAALMCRLAETA